jgi:hypothetical protein
MALRDVTSTRVQALAGFGKGLAETSNSFADSEIRYYFQ